MQYSCLSIRRLCASCPSLRFSAVACIALLGATVAACQKDRVKVRGEDKNKPADYKRTELIKAAAEAGDHPSPKAFRRFAARVAELAPGFSESVRAEAERALVFMAADPMAALVDKSPIEQRDALATTVWPTAFGVEPKSGETPAAYVERICRDDLALDCKYAVPEYQPVLLSSLAWRKLKERARDSYKTCDQCGNDARFERVLQRYDKYDRIMSGRAGNAADRAHPRAWPFAGKNGRRWSGAPVLAIKLSGKATFRGKSTKPGKWRDAIARSAAATEPLGVYLHPKDRVSTLRGVMADAASAGYSEIALQARVPEYPFELREYRLVTKPGKGSKIKKLMVRDIDTIQVLVQTLNANTDPDGPKLTI